MTRRNWEVQVTKGQRERERQREKEREREREREGERGRERERKRGRGRERERERCRPRVRTRRVRGRRERCLCRTLTGIENIVKILGLKLKKLKGKIGRWWAEGTELTFICTGEKWQSRHTVAGRQEEGGRLRG